MAGVQHSLAAAVPGIAHLALEHSQELPVPTWLCLSLRSLPLLLMAPSSLGLKSLQSSQMDGGIYISGFPWPLSSICTP